MILTNKKLIRLLKTILNTLSFQIKMMPVKRKSAFSAKSVAKAGAAVTPTKSEVTSTPPPSKSEYDVINQINQNSKFMINTAFQISLNLLV